MTSTIATAALLGTKRLLLVKSTASADADLLKATIAKTIVVPAYTRKDGVHVPAHTKVVHYDPSKDHADVLSGKGSHSQKQAHKKLSKLGHWESLDEQHKLAHILSSATNIQQKASASASVSGWKAAMAAGKLPSASQQAAFAALPKDKQDALLAEVSPAKAAAPAPSPYQLVGDVGFSNEGPLFKFHGDYAKVEKLLGMPAGALDHTDSTTYTVKNAAGQTFSIYKHGGALSVRTSGGNNDHSSAAALVSHLEENATGLSDALKDPAAAKLHAGMNKPGSWYANMTGDDKAKWLSENSGAAAAAIDADEKDAPAADFSQQPAFKKYKQTMDGWAAAGDKFALQTMIDNNKVTSPHLAEYAEKLLARLGDPSPKVGDAIHTFNNEADGVSAWVVFAGSGKFNVALKDTDAGKFLSASKQFNNEADAVAHAKKLAGIKNLEGKPAYDHMASSGTSKNPLVPSAKEWLAANPGKEDELSSALVDLGMLSVAQLLGIYKPPGFGAGQSHGPDAAGAKPAVTTKVSIAGHSVVASPGGEGYTVTIDGLQSGGTFKTSSAAIAHAHQTILNQPSSADANPKEGDTKPGADGSTLVLKDGHWVKQGDKPKTGPVGMALAAAINSKLAQIPWDAQLLPAENSNAKSHNGQIAKVKAMADAGDVAGLQAYVDGKAGAKQTYAKKQHLLAATALAALKEGGTSAAPAAESAPVAAAVVPAPAVKVSAAVKKIQAMDPAAVAEWLASKPGKMSPFAMSFFDHATKAGRDKFIKWVKASRSLGMPDHWKASYQSAAVASLFGQHDKTLIDGVGFVPTKSVTVGQAQSIITDPAVIQKAAIAAASGLPLPGKAKPAKPSLSPSAHWESVADEIDKAIDAGDANALSMKIETTEGMQSPNAIAIHNYAKAGLAYLGAQQPKTPPTVTPLQEEALVNAIKINGGTMPGAGTGVGYYAGIWDSLTPGQQEYLTEKAAAKPAAQLDPNPADLVPLMEAVNAAGPTSVAKKAAIRYLEAFPNSQLAVNQVHDALYNAGYIGLASAFAKDGKPGLESAGDTSTESVSIPAPLLHNTQDGHSKFWSVSVNGKELTTVYGKIGTKGLTSKKQFDSTHDAKVAADNAIKSKIKGGYHNTGKSMPHEYPADGGAAEVGPKEGDTKQGADGMLVLKNGHWVKVPGQDSAAWSVTMKDPSFSGVNTLTAELDGSAIYVAYEPESMTFEAGIMDPEGGEPDSDHFGSPKEVLDYLAGKFGSSVDMPSLGQVEKLTGTVTGKTYSPAKPAPVAPAPVSASGYEAMDNWKQTGPQGGSNPGGRYRDEHGNEWYCKFPADEDIAKSEVLAAKLYCALGISGQDCKLITKGGKVGIASRWIAVNKTTAPELAKLDGTASGFGADAWLGNWDVVGLGYDNLQVGPDGKAHRVDAGGSLMYRAQGGKKQFGATVLEIDSLRDSTINPQAAAVFGKMTQADISASVAKVLALPDQSIVSLVNQYGPGDDASKQTLAHTLIARKADLAAKFPKAMKAPKKVLDPSNLPVKPSDLPKPHDFENWNGQGKGLSSKDHVNKANASVEYQILSSAQAGNLPELKAFHYTALDKETGLAGAALPIANHPSKHVVQYHSDLVQILEEIANPPEPLKIFQETDVSTLDQLAASLPSKKFGTTVDSVQSNEKLGFWVVLGVAPSALKFKPAHALDYSKAAIDAGYVKFKQGASLAKHFIKSVQASGSYNDLFRSGKSTDHSGNKLSDVAKAALAHATSQPEGTTIYRWQKMTDAMVSKVMAAQDGTVFQATGPMCTSYSPTATQHFGKHRVTIRYAKGAKAVDSFGSDGYKSEKEVTTLPNSRFVILKKEMVPDTNNGGQRLELELLMLPPDLGL